MSHNGYNRLNTSHTFENFKPQNPEQIQIAANLKKFSDNVISRINGAIVKRPPDWSPHIHGPWKYFDNAKLIGLEGAPGVGKSHLLAALFHNIIGKTPPEVQKNFCYYPAENMSEELRGWSGTHYSLQAIDGLYDRKEDEEEITAEDIDLLGKYIYNAYRNNCLIVVTSNFSLANILDRVSKSDPTDRLGSRIRTMANPQNLITVTGDNYRDIEVAQTASDDPWKF